MYNNFIKLTGIWKKVPLFSTGYEYNGTTGTLPFFKKIGPWIGVAGWPVPSFPAEIKLKPNYINFIMQCNKTQSRLLFFESKLPNNYSNEYRFCHMIKNAVV